MQSNILPRRQFIKRALATASLAVSGSLFTGKSLLNAAEPNTPGSQRLSIKQLQKWESLKYGMFLSFGMSTFVQKELPDGSHKPTVYAPDKLDADQWVSVARDAGMKYVVLTAKHVAGHCLWPSKHTDYTVANSTNKTNVVEQLCKACEKRGVLPGLYYCSWDNHNRFGSRTRSDVSGGWDQNVHFPRSQKNLGPYTTSLYQSFQTAQVTELLKDFGPIAEMWIDIPGELGHGYRTFLYNHIAKLQPQTVIMMNSGTPSYTQYNTVYAWPSDLVAIERGLPPKKKYQPWHTIEGKQYYMPGEVCDPIGHQWFWMPGDPPRPDAALAKQLEACRDGNVNLLLNVPPDTHGLIPKEHVDALMRLRKNVRI
ncbi:MAG: alpha-L-fucosidase [Pirellulales bacterium]|nr:alpha-L-fucosidase [Pirellulales bacterium]